VSTLLIQSANQTAITMMRTRNGARTVQDVSTTLTLRLVTDATQNQRANSIMRSSRSAILFLRRVSTTLTPSCAAQDLRVKRCANGIMIKRRSARRRITDVSSTLHPCAARHLSRQILIRRAISMIVNSSIAIRRRTDVSTTLIMKGAEQRAIAMMTTRTSARRGQDVSTTLTLTNATHYQRANSIMVTVRSAILLLLGVSTTLTSSVCAAKGCANRIMITSRLVRTRITDVSTTLRKESATDRAITMMGTNLGAIRVRKNVSTTITSVYQLMNQYHRRRHRCAAAFNGNEMETKRSVPGVGAC